MNTMRLLLLTLLLVLSFALQSNAATLVNYDGNDSRAWDEYVVNNSYENFIIDLPSSGTLTAGTPLSTPYEGKYITFDQDITFTTVSDYFVEIDWTQGWRTLNMIDTGDADQIVMTLHGFSVLGFGYEIKPNSDGWYGSGFRYSGRSFTGSINGDGGTDHTSSDVQYYSPYFFGTITDGEGEDDITEITIFTTPLSNPSYPQNSTGFYLGDFHFIENSPVPVPGSILILGVGLLGLAGVSRRK